ncbi:hypothetical protein LUZ60_012948 [Juncus effusus]|nr:hypothetical protein LUZ60_012948 [Juncus effusus]
MGNSINPCFSGNRHVSPATATSIAVSYAYCPTNNPTDQTNDNTYHATNNPTPNSFYGIKGASMAANVATPLSSLLSDDHRITSSGAAATVESSRSFTANPLQPRASGSLSGPLSGPLSETGSVSDRSFFSGPLEVASSFSCSSSLNSTSGARFQRSITQIIEDRRRERRYRRKSRSLLRFFSKLCRNNKSNIPTATQNGTSNETNKNENLETEENQINNVQWAQGKAGEDRVTVVVSEDHGWVFVGIYDGFNGPDATDFLQTHLYPTVHLELKTLLLPDQNCDHNPDPNSNIESSDLSDVNKILRKQLSKPSSSQNERIQHKQILNALAEALKKTEEKYFEMAENRGMQNPELGLMGSCLLVVLLKGEHVYLMNVGDSRAVLAQKKEPDLSDIIGKSRHDEINHGEEIRKAFDMIEFNGLTANQLTSDHSTSIDEEVKRIMKEHPDDLKVVENDRVKGKLKVTRAFGAGYLKHPKWNDSLLEAFKIKNYVGNSPYITCTPDLHHHMIRPEDKFIVLSSDGLYQYFTNEELVEEINLFTSNNPEGDPAQYLLEEVLIRASTKHGIQFDELVSLPQENRRRYYDDISIIIISVEGRSMWRSWTRN